MHGWIADLRAAWRDERIVLTSPMPVEAARAWVSAGADLRLRRTARTGGGRDLLSAWQPILRGRLTPDGTGSRFTGTLGWKPLSRVRSTVWLAGAPVIALVTAGFGVSAAVGGDGPDAWYEFALAAAAIVLGAAVLGYHLYCYRRARSQVDYLRSWITGAMQAPSAVPPRDPRDGGGLVRQ